MGSSLLGRKAEENINVKQAQRWQVLGALAEIRASLSIIIRCGER